MPYVYGVDVKFKKGDYVRVVDPTSVLRGLVFRVNRRRYTNYFLELLPDVSYSRLNMSRANIAYSLNFRSFYERSLKLYNHDKLDGDKL